MKSIVLIVLMGLLMVGGKAQANALVPPVERSEGKLAFWLTPSAHPVKLPALTFTLELPLQPKAAMSAPDVAEGNDKVPAPREARRPWEWPKVAVVPVTRIVIHRPESPVNPETRRKIG